MIHTLKTWSACQDDWQGKGGCHISHQCTIKTKILQVGMVLLAKVLLSVELNVLRKLVYTILAKMLF